MNPPQYSPTELMVPQVLFQCHHCRVALQVPLSFAGHSGPCPQCGKMIQTPYPQTMPVSVAVEENPTVKKRANPALTYATDAPALLARSFSMGNDTPRSLNRGVMPDQAVHHGHEMKKEQRKDMKMVLWFVLVILFLAAATYLMKSFVVGS